VWPKEVLDEAVGGEGGGEGGGGEGVGGIMGVSFGAFPGVLDQKNSMKNIKCAVRSELRGDPALRSQIVEGWTIEGW
jgi:hypothetical protein